MARLPPGRLAALALIVSIVAACCATTSRAPTPPPARQAPAVARPPQQTRADVSVPRPCHLDPQEATGDITLAVVRQSQSIPYAADEDSKLCWATGIAMVSTYLGRPRIPCQIASLRPDAIIGCCRTAEERDTGGALICNQGANSHEIGQAMRRLGLYRTHLMRPLTEEELTKELASGRPVLIDRENGETKFVRGHAIRGRHIVVVTARIGKTYRILDPSPFSPDPVDQTYHELVKGMDDDRPWKESWYQISFREDRCNPGFLPGCSCEAP